VKAAVNLSALSNADLQNLIHKLTQKQQIMPLKLEEHNNNRKIVKSGLPQRNASVWIEKAGERKLTNKEIEELT
jgi:hypothetical protein